MEPMTLSPLAGSPVNQQSHQMAGNINFLPAFLMGESTTPVTNPMSPNNARNLAFGQQQQHHYQQQSQHPRDVTQSPNDLNRSILQQRSLFGFQSPPPSNVNNGPPTKGLFDALQEEKNFIEHSPFNHNQMNRSNRPTTSASFNQSYQYNPNQSINDSYLNQSEFHTSHIMSPPQSYDFRHSMANSSNMMISSRQSSFWITVFGFPQSATSMILSHFAQCGTIVEKVYAPQCGNWIHLKYSSRLECDKAINYNERIIGTGFMIGVVYCKDESIVDKENIEKNSSLPVNRVRPLAHVAYKNAQTPTEVAASPTAPKKSSGIINNVMESIFGW